METETQRRPDGRSAQRPGRQRPETRGNADPAPCPRGSVLGPSARVAGGAEERRGEGVARVGGASKAQRAGLRAARAQDAQRAPSRGAFRARWVEAGPSGRRRAG